MEREYCKKCSKCRERAVVIASVPYETQVNHDGRLYAVKIPALSVPQCTNCGNFSLDHEASEQITRAFRKQAGLLEPDDIRQHREKLGLTQEALADMLGVDAAEVSRWENNERIQQRSVDRFLRAFFTVPELRRSLADRRSLDLSPVS